MRLGLTCERVALEDGGTAVPYRWRGEDVLVRDDAATVLSLIEALGDDSLDDAGKQRRCLPLVFADWGEAWIACDFDRRALAELVQDAVWDVHGIDLRGDRRHDEPLWDPVEDAAAIRASLRAEYGIDWDAERARISFGEFVALVGGLSTSTPLGRAIYYRNPKTRPKPMRKNANRREIEEWERLHAALALKGRAGGRKGGDGAMSDAFAALKRVAR